MKRLKGAVLSKENGHLTKGGIMLSAILAMVVKNADQAGAAVSAGKAHAGMCLQEAPQAVMIVATQTDKRDQPVRNDLLYREEYR